MEKRIITTPIDNKQIEDLNIGDVVYLTGMLVTLSLIHI